MVTLQKAALSAPLFTDQDGIAHGFFTRQGGVSTGIYKSLNCGLGSDDQADYVQENRSRVAESLGVAADQLITPFQKHSATAITAETAWNSDSLPQGDAIVTKTRGLAIGVVTADCAPVLLCDPEARVIAAAHAGWRGALSGIVEATVAAMVALGAKPDSIIAAIGPTISRSAYEVGSDYVENFVKEDPAAAPFFATEEATGEPHFDLPAYVAERLSRAGIDLIADLGLCTYCDEARLYSYRRSQHWGEADYGRQISAIVLT